MQIREAVAGDVEVISRFNQALALESENLTLDEHVIRSGVRRALNSPHLCRYFVAECEGVVVGQTMVTYELTDWRDGLIYWIQSVYVKPEARGQGVFRSLHAYVLNWASQNSEVKKVRLYVENNNLSAIQTYERLGMKLAHYTIYETDV